MRKPYYRKDRKCWFVKINGGRTQIRLHEDESTAYKLWEEMRSASNPDAVFAPLAAMAEQFLRHAKRTIGAETYKRYAYYVADFCNHAGADKLPSREVKAEQLYQWIEQRPAWGAWAQRSAIAAIKRVFAWGIEQGMIDRNPMLVVKRPPAKRREQLIDDDQHSAMMLGSQYGKAGRVFRQVLIALRHSGARPGEVASVLRSDVTHDVTSWVLREHKTADKTGRPRVIYLSPCLQTLTKILVHFGQSTNLFVNSDGEPWSRNAIRCRMRRLRKKLGLPAGVVAYAYRHTWATKALTGGTDIATVAELLGHSSTDMVSRHYGHLDQAKEHLKKAAGNVIRRNQ